MPPIVRVFADQAALIAAAADLFVDAAQTAVSRNGRFLIALSGGGTPRALFQHLSRPAFARLPFWQATHVFWGDERLVPPDDDGSNYKMAHDLLLKNVTIPETQIYRARGEWEPETAVLDYTQQLKNLAPPGSDWPRFDLALMGLGSDGHTASLFPGPISLAETSRPVIAVTADYGGRPAHRLTLTPLVFNDAHHLVFLVTGESKMEAVTAVLQTPPNPQQWPAQRIRPHNGQITWLLDQAAGQRLTINE